MPVAATPIAQKKAFQAVLDRRTQILKKGGTLLTVHKGQREVLNGARRFKVVVAGRRWGKTQCAKVSIVKASKVPNRLIWYVAPTYGMARSILWDELRDAFPKALVVSINETRMSIKLRNGTRIELKGADKPDTLRGVGIHFLVMDECQDIKEDTWKKVLRPTLASTRGEVLFIGTPKQFNWLYEIYMLGQRDVEVQPDGTKIRTGYYIDRKGRRHSNAWISWQFPTIMSPFIPKEEIDQARQDMTEKDFKQEFEASFETMSGRVYYCFDRAEHVGNFPFNPNLPIWIGQDFNIDPMSSVIMQPQPNGDVWIVDEIILFGSNSQETANELAKRYWKYMGASQITVYPDPAGANRGHQRGESDLDILRAAGFKRMKYRRKHPLVADRVNDVNAMLKNAEGQVRMFIHHTCKHTIECFEKVIYKPGSREVDKTMNLEHPGDAVGYCMNIERNPRRHQMVAI